MFRGLDAVHMNTDSKETIKGEWLKWERDNRTWENL